MIKEKLIHKEEKIIIIIEFANMGLDEKFSQDHIYCNLKMLNNLNPF